MSLNVGSSLQKAYWENEVDLHEYVRIVFNKLNIINSFDFKNDF